MCVCKKKKADATRKNKSHCYGNRNHLRNQNKRGRKKNCMGKRRGSFMRQFDADFFCLTQIGILIVVEFVFFLIQACLPTEGVRLLDYWITICAWVVLSAIPPLLRMACKTSNLRSRKNAAATCAVAAHFGLHAVCALLLAIVAIAPDEKPGRFLRICQMAFVVNIPVALVPVVFWLWPFKPSGRIYSPNDNNV